MTPKSMQNRDRAILALAKSMPRVHRRDGDTLRISLKGEIRQDGKSGITPIPIEAALLSHRDAPHVEITINSPGGDLNSSDRICAAIDNHPGHITVIADRWCASAATHILLCGDFRQATEGTWLLFHAAEAAPKNGERWTAAKHARFARELQQCEKKCVEFYAKRTGRDATIFAEEIKNEKRMSLARAMQLGVLHCMEGEEIWRNGRPFSFHASRSTPPPLLALRQDEFGRYRQRWARAVHAGAIPLTQIHAHVAFSKAGGFDGDFDKLLRFA